jgi:hypothetical protein
MVAAIIAGVRRAFRVPVMLRYLAAGLAVDALRIEILAKPFQASRVIWKHAVEVVNGELLRLVLPVVPEFAVAHRYMLSQAVPTVKG